MLDKGPSFPLSYCQLIAMLKRFPRTCVLLLTIAAAVPAACGRSAPVGAGAPAPAFTLRNIASGTTSFPGDGRGKVVVIHFWLSSCAFCREEMRAIDALQQQLGTKDFLALSVNAGDQRSAAERYVRDLTLSYPVLLDPEGATARRYGVSAVPMTFIVDRRGRIGHRIFGEVTRQILEQMAAPLLGAK
jgi:peroxiredoxin